MTDTSHLTERQLAAWIGEGEHQRQDFKYKITDSAKLARTISAFANTDGGRLLIGVRDDGVLCGVRLLRRREYRGVACTLENVERPGLRQGCVDALL